MEQYKSKLNDIKLFISEYNVQVENEIEQKIEDYVKVKKRKVEVWEADNYIEHSFSNEIILNIGGMEFQTSRTILSTIPGSYFYLMFLGEIEIKPITTTPNSFFIDRDGTYFRYVLKYLKDQKDIEIPYADSLKLYEIRREFEFYSIKVKIYSNPISKIIEKEYFKILADWFVDHSNPIFSILYRSSEHQHSAFIFHEKCDNKGPTITIVETTEGDIFGGYNSQSWNSDGNYYGDNNCFIFTLVNKHKIKPTKYRYHLRHKIDSVLGDRSHGPCFSRDFTISNHCDTNLSCQKFPTSYIDTTGRGKKTLALNTNYKVKDYEVFNIM
ncbi:hypothetical protein CYY_004172 [Polysphondylium violaceum]|uniref:TLDc domain-containing protein n=1 Tax=Polysphondylium violaceum TaxID=133409 RepID=A0A8J4V7Z9_9MYCE|nr:hypothetical protein CYY_004172 [Polysphondylium violaceum]